MTLKSVGVLSSVIAAADNPGFTNWFTSELAVVEDKLLTVVGDVPSYLSGLFAQSGPGRFELGNVSFGHALDGFSKTLRIRFDTSGSEPKLTFSTDFLQSRFYNNSLEKGKIAASMTA